jgi:Histidine kinase-, DNA gyrase B-, and HSP90-like ATPase
MTKLYSDEELAPLREYSTNARDAMIMAGKSDLPIHVHTPTFDNPYLTIQDFGIGMSIDEMRSVYSKYGKSTKRGSNDVQGMLGLGGKSALAYTSQFTVESVKDNQRVQAIVTRNEDGIGVINVVDVSPTSEGNGTKIVIPTRRGNDFHHKAERFFYYWQPGTVLLNGEEPELLVTQDRVSKIGARNYVLPETWSGSDVIVMGNVAYELPDRRLSMKITERRNSIIIHFAKEGAVTFAPSREALSYTAKTNAYLDQIQKELVDEVKKSVLGELGIAKTHGQAFEVWARWVNQIGPGKLPSMSFQGEKFISYKDVSHFGIKIGEGRYNHSTGEYGNKVFESSRVELRALMLPNVLVVLGYDNATKPTPAASKKTALYMEQNNLKHDQVLFFSTNPASPWTDDVKSVKWADINAIKLPRNASTGGGQVGTIPVVIYRGGGSKSYYSSNSNKGKWDAITILDTDEKILYCSPADIPDIIGNINDVHLTFPNMQIVGLGRNRWDKFLRENPTAEEFSFWYGKNFAKMLKESLTEAELFYADHDSDYRNVAKMLATSDDPDFALLTRPVRTGTIDIWNRNTRPTKSLTKKYPLVDRYSYTGDKNKKHNLLYVNAVYNEGN